MKDNIYGNWHLLIITEKLHHFVQKCYIRRPQVSHPFSSWTPDGRIVDAGCSTIGHLYVKLVDTGCSFSVVYIKKAYFLLISCWVREIPCNSRAIFNLSQLDLSSPIKFEIPVSCSKHPSGLT